MRFIRTLVLRETRIAVDAKHRFLHRSHVTRRKVSEFGIDRIHQRFQGSTNVLLIDVLARLKPLTLVIALQPSKEGNRFAREAREVALGEKAAVGIRHSAFGR